jgi:hypothetical protein
MPTILKRNQYLIDRSSEDKEERKILMETDITEHSKGCGKPNASVPL